MFPRRCFTLESNPDPSQKYINQKRNTKTQKNSFTGADLAALVRSAATLAAEEGDDGAESVGARHFAEALKGARPSRRVGGGGSGSGSGSGSVEENGKEAEPVFASFSRPGLG